MNLIKLLVVFCLAGCLSGYKTWDPKLVVVVSGLKDNVMLQEMQTGEILNIHKNGVTLFSSAYRPGDAFNLKILQQPGAPEQLCEIQAGRGVMGRRSARIRIHCQDDSVMCTAIYSPVCAVVTTPIMCITTPCISPQQYQTFSNECEAIAAGADVVLHQLCGDQEGQPVTSIQMLPLAAILIPESDPMQVQSVSVAEDLLKITVSYSGGCSEHTLDLIGNTNFEGRLPAVQNQILLTHDSNEDACEAYITRELTFNLTPLKKQYQDTYKTEHGQVALNLAVLGEVKACDGKSGKGYRMVYSF